jgi:hypothetical protein
MNQAVSQASEPLRRRRPLLHPSRWPAIIGAVAITVGTYLPWRTIVYPEGRPEVMTGTSTWDAPGQVLFAMAGLALVACALPQVARSPTRVVQLLPAVLGAIPALLAAEDYQQISPEALASAASSNVTLEPGFWTCVAGSVMVALGGLATSAVVIRDNPRPAPAARGWNMDPAAWRPFLALTIGIVGGVAATVALVPALGSIGGLGAPALAVLLAAGIGLFVNVVLEAFWPDREARDRAMRRRAGGPPPDPGMPELEPLEKSGRGR